MHKEFWIFYYTITMHVYIAVVYWSEATTCHVLSNVAKMSGQKEQRLHPIILRDIYISDLYRIYMYTYI